MSTDPTASPGTSQDTFQLQPSPPPSIDDDPDSRGVYRLVPNLDPQTSRTSVESVPGTMVDGDRTTSVVNLVGTQDRQASSTTLVQTIGMALSKLFKPARKDSKAARVTHELKTILFGSCASYFPERI